MIKTKIICTLGPSTDSPETLHKLAKAGMNIARLNFSHGTYGDHQKRINALNALNSKLDIPTALMLDTKGPEIRTGICEKPLTLIDGSEIVLTTKDVLCTEKTISLSYKKLGKIVKLKSIIYIADGTIELKVEKFSGSDIVCKIIVGGELSSHKNVAIPGAIIDLPSIAEQDRKDIEFGVKNNIDFVAQSFTRSASDIKEMKALLKKLGSKAEIIAKIEEPMGLKNIDEIIAAADGIMIARGDLGVQIPIEQVPNVQKMIIKKCEAAAKPVIVATQMLESMIKNPRPTRAEVTDVANAILDGADAIMLSGETAIGQFPIRAVEMMGLIAKETEPRIGPGIRKYLQSAPIAHSISQSVCNTAADINAAAIITCTMSGHTAKFISKNRPRTPIIAVTPNPHEVRQLNLCFGVYPLLIKMPDSIDDLIDHAIKAVTKKGLVKKNDVVVITAGIPFTTPGNINLMKVHRIE